MLQRKLRIWTKEWRGPLATIVFTTFLAIASFAIVFSIGLIAGLGRDDSLSMGKMAGVLGAAAVVLAIVFAAIQNYCRNRRRTLIAVGAVIGSILLLYAEEDLRGWWQWHHFKRLWEAKGEKFSVTAFAPASVPAEQNFAMAPIWVESMKAILGPQNSPRWFGTYAENGRTNFADRLRISATFNHEDPPPSGSGNWQMGKKSDLTAWQRYFQEQESGTNAPALALSSEDPAQTVVTALNKYDSTVEELRRAAELPYSRFPVEYTNDFPAEILLPHLADVRTAASTLQLRALAELQQGATEKALADIKLSSRLAESIRSEPILISQLVRIAILQFTIQPIWEGIVEHRWNDAQLADIAGNLAEQDWIEDYGFAMRAELAMMCGNIDYMSRHPEWYFLSTSLSTGKTRVAGWFVPRGWFDLNRLNCARPMLEDYIPVANPDERIFSPEQLTIAHALLSKDTEHFTPYNVMERFLVPSLAGTPIRFASAQTSLDLTRTAIALERFRLAHGEYPETLAALPQQLIARIPHDVITSQPLNYRRTADGKFVLYSVGWNKIDDGGTVALTEGSTPRVNIHKGDWVWKFPNQ